MFQEKPDLVSSKKESLYILHEVNKTWIVVLRQEFNGLLASLHCKVGIDVLGSWGAGGWGKKRPMFGYKDAAEGVKP